MLRMICCAAVLNVLCTATPAVAVERAAQTTEVVTSHTAREVTAQAELTPRQAERYHQLIDVYRCPKCQNANLAGSDSPIALDLKHKILQMVKADQSDAQIRDYLVTRYGEFISYQPVIKPATWLLWFLPPLMLLIGILYWLIHTRRRPSSTPLSSEERWRLSQLLSQRAEPEQTQAEVHDDRQ